MLNETKEIADMIETDEGAGRAAQFRDDMKQLDQESALQTVVDVSIHGNRRDRVEEAYLKIYSRAVDKFKGTTYSDSGIMDQTEVRTPRGQRLSDLVSTPRFFANTFYVFGRK